MVHHGLTDLLMLFVQLPCAIGWHLKLLFMLDLLSRFGRDMVLGFRHMVAIHLHGKNDDIDCYNILTGYWSSSRK